MQKDINHNLQKWNDEKIYGKNIKIAVLDTGIDKNSSDLSYIKGVNFTSDNVDEFADDNGHGTKIAGIIGARKNNHTLLGIAPESDLYIAKVANGNGDVKFENLVKGIYWDIEQNVDIINISLEFSGRNGELHEAVKKASEKNIIVVSSSGNIKQEGDSGNAYPGAYPEVIGVGMLNVKGKIYAEEFKKKKVDVFAPGEDIFSLYFDNKMTLDTGVSFATAYTPGYSALLIQKHKDNNTRYDQKQIISELKKDLEKKM
ncbi:serine protease [Bacillus clarus]|uniref:Serine protease n=1 Tax=Bacillus clarus TaxID=2338372 RepID=A0A090YSY1_9BACI|nr:S8 family serine peptidase [Bacillus clarus]KFM95195.1 subtilase family protein [Bacillus clarus]RFT63419.1 serine protease [Bacillus clarus]